MYASLISKITRFQAIGMLAAAAAFAGEPASTVQLQSESGTVTFESPTNMPGIEVKGKSGALSAKVEVSRESNKLTLRQLDASVAVTTLATGMKVRDEHMRKYIFRTNDGQEPDLRFTAADSVCEKQGSAHEFLCPINGELSIRGIAKPFTLTLHAKEEGASAESFRATGDALVRLSTYGIPAPSQFGVKPSDEVKVHIEFTAKAKHVTTAGVVR